MADTLRPHHPAMTVVGGIFAVAAIAFLGHVVWVERHRIIDAASTLSALSLIAAVAAFAAMSWTKALYHALIVGELHPLMRTTDAAVKTAYLAGQVLRYLPGKVWGVVYQAHALGAVCPPSVVVLANGLQMLISAGVTMLVAGALIGLHRGYWIGPMFAALAVLAALLANAHLQWVGQMLARWRRQPAPDAGERSGGSSLVAAVRGSMLLAADWLFFIFGFVAIGAGTLTLWESSVMSALYAGASTLATLAVTVPAGIGVREALFVSAPQLIGQTAAALVVVGVLARFTLLAGDLVAAAIAIGIGRVRSRNG